MTESEREELDNLLSRLDELSFTEGVDSEEYEEVEKELESKSKLYGGLDVISED